MPESSNTAGRGGNWNPTGKTVVDPRPVPGENAGVFIVWGQSSATNAAAGTYVPTNAAHLFNLNPYDGGIYRASGSLLGCDYADNLTNVDNMFTRAGDKLLTDDVFDRVILAPCGMGGTFIAQWEASLYQRIIATWKRCLAQGYDVTAILQQHGEWDNNFGTTQAAYRASGNAVIAKVRAAGCSAPWFIAKSTYYSNPGAAIRAAIDQIVSDTANVFAGPDTDVILTPAGRYDAVHWNATGADQAAGLWRDVLAGDF
ncbi:hypothetical protein BLM15_07455 [Bosea sp. Tri-49]|nr:hypothetical protein BLM15_07455 [Bosea sp. Tri-49]